MKYLAAVIIIALVLAPTTLTPQAQTENRVTFAAAGDWDCNDDTRATISGIQNHDVDVVLALGDLAYTVSNADCWFDVSAPIDDKVKFVLGNHDDENLPKYEQYMTHYGLSEPYYSFDIENIHFLVLSTEPSCDTCDFKTTEPQYAFAKTDLEDAARNPEIDWIVVSMHKPLYTNMKPGHNDYNIFKKIYQPLFDKNNVDLVLAGHVHNYQRTPVLKFNPAVHSSPIVTDDSLRTIYNPDGEVYVVVGTGGRELAGHDEVKPYMLTYEENHHGFLLVEVEDRETTTELMGKFYVNGQYPSGADYFMIIKPQRSAFGQGMAFAGDNFDEISNAPKLAEYTIAAQFNTCENFPAGNYFLVNKGGIGTDAPGKNMNYGIWMLGDERLRAGFEAVDGTDYIVTSTDRYNDCHDHYIVSTFDGEELRLYVDGRLVASLDNIDELPDNTGSQPLRIGANSLKDNGYFEGMINEVRVFNTTMSAQQVFDATYYGSFALDGDIVYRHYD